VHVLCILINYESDELALKFAKQLSGMKGTEVLIVDNTPAESRGLGELVNKTLPTVTCLSPDDNLGYFNGAHWGLSRYLDNSPLPDWVMVSNVDLELQDIRFFEHLSELPTANVGVVGPSIWSTKSMRDLNPRYTHRPNGARMRSYKYIYRTWLGVNAYDALGFLKAGCKFAVRRLHIALRATKASTGESPMAIYAPQGSCLLFSREYFKRGGSLAYPSFLFGEELYVAETVRRLGLEVYYHPIMRIRHYDHASTHIPRSPRMCTFIYDSAVYIADTYFAD
jgi:GT2 family glycosyltransferase